MARELCREIIKNLTGREYSERELDRLSATVEKRANALRNRDRLLSTNEAITLAAERLIQDLKRRATQHKRVTLLNEGKRLEALSSISENWGNQLGLGLRSLVTGTQRGVKGARISAAGQQDALRAELIGGLHASLAKLGAEDLRLFTSDVLEDDIARGLWLMSQEEPNPGQIAKLNPAAVRLAEVISQYQDLARLLANKQGADIGKYQGYVFRASHDPLRIAGHESRWRKVAEETFDLPRMMEEMGSTDERAMLDSLYMALSTGLHLRYTAPLDGKGTPNIATRVSQEKVVHFKTADDFISYNRQFGYGNLRETVVAGLEQSARNTGLMQVLGTNPGAFIEAMEAQLAKRMREKGASAADTKRFRKDIQDARNRLAEVDGSLDTPGNATLATYSQAIRAVQTMSSLGASLISSFTDLGMFALSARHNGVNVLQAASTAVGGLFKGRPRAEQIELASALGVVFESMTGKLSSRFSLDDGGRGAIASAQQQFFKFNLQRWWTDSLRFAAAEMLSHNLAGHAGRAFADLDPRLAKTLSLYGLDEAGWNVARGAVRKAEDGTELLSPADIADEKVARALRAYFTDQNGYLMLSPDAETRYLAKMGTQKGTVAGEAIRFAMQFKSFSVAFSQRLIGRELISHIDPNVRGAGVYGAAMTNGAALLGLSQLFLMSTVMGYLAMSMKDMLKGKEPRDPSDLTTMLAAMQQGGGLGIMGDFLFGQSNRMGGGFIGTIVGPTAGDIEAVANIFFKGREAALDPDKSAEVGDDLFRLTYGNLPGNNLFYVKPVMDYLFMWNLNETMNPGAMERMERNAARQGQEFFISPTQRVAEQQATGGR